MKYHFLYETTCHINGKTYRGKHSTSNIDDCYLGSGIALNRAIKKYGRQNFSRQIISIHETADTLNLAEREWINVEFVQLSSNYNLATGGQGGAAPFVVMTAEQRSARSKKAAIKKFSGIDDAWRAAHAAKRLAWQNDAATRNAASKKQSQKMRGRSKETHPSIALQLQTRARNHKEQMDKWRIQVAELLNKSQSVSCVAAALIGTMSRSTVYHLAKEMK